MPGAGTSKQSSNTDQVQKGEVNPYGPSVGAINGILGGINSMIPNYQANGTQTNALNQIQTNAQNLPNYAPQATQLANSLISGGPNYQTGVNDAYGQYQGAVSPFLSGSLDPMQTPGLSDALATIRSDVGNSVNGMFAGAGRDLSGLNQQALARGISQGEAPVIVGQYNQNVANRMNAANGLLSGAQSTATTNSGLQQTQYGNQLAGVTNGASMIGNAANASPNAQLAAAAQAFGIPIQNLAQLEALTVPIAGLGKDYKGSTDSSSVGYSTASPLSQIGQAVGIFGGLFG